MHFTAITVASLLIILALRLVSDDLRTHYPLKYQCYEHKSQFTIIFFHIAIELSLLLNYQSKIEKKREKDGKYDTEIDANYSKGYNEVVTKELKWTTIVTSHDSITVHAETGIKLALTVTRRGAFDNAPVRPLRNNVHTYTLCRRAHCAGSSGFLKTAGERSTSLYARQVVSLGKD